MDVSYYKRLKIRMVPNVYGSGSQTVRRDAVVRCFVLPGASHKKFHF